MLMCCDSKGFVHNGLFDSAYVAVPPPPPAQEPPCARTAPWFRGRILAPLFFYHGIGFFMVLVDAGQLFRCAGQRCVAMGPPIRGGGGAISQSQAHIPLKPLRTALDPFPEATSP